MKLAVLVVLLVTVLALPAFSTDYVLTDLGRGAACAINDSGQITGFRYDPESGKDIGFFWDKSIGFIYIGASVGRNINNRGQVTGGAWIWEYGVGVTGLSVPTGIGSITGSAINDSMQVVGAGYSQSGIYDALVWLNPNSCINLGVWDNPNSWAYDINESGTVVGEYWPTPGENHAFKWSQSLGFVDLGDFGTIMARADSVNDSGQIVGTYYNGNSYGFLLDPDGTFLSLGHLGGGHSWAHKINDNNQIVGRSRYQSGNPDVHAFLWSEAGGMTELLIPNGCENSSANDINRYGHIVGSFTDSSGYEHIALWEPVPEPSSLLALGGGLIGFIGIRRKH